MLGVRDKINQFETAFFNNKRIKPGSFKQNHICFLTLSAPTSASFKKKLYYFFKSDAKFFKQFLIKTSRKFWTESHENWGKYESKIV